MIRPYTEHNKKCLILIYTISIKELKYVAMIHFTTLNRFKTFHGPLMFIWWDNGTHKQNH